MSGHTQTRMGFKLNDRHNVSNSGSFLVQNGKRYCIPISRATETQHVAAWLSEHVVRSFPDGTRFMKRETVEESSQPVGCGWTTTSLNCS